MDEPDDIQLLRRFVEDSSEPAFAELVQRHINLVYSVALRQTRDPHAAQDVTQAVFVVLARKAHGLLRLRTLTGWLYQAARLTAANHLRAEARRARREQEAYMQSLTNEPDPSLEEAWTRCAPILDDAMGELGDMDRNSILLRYFQNRSLRDVGVALGINDDAARMRVNRGLDKLRRFFAKRGVSLSAVAIAGALSTKSIQAAPVELVHGVAAGAAQGAALASSVALLAKETLKLLAWIRYKVWVSLSASAIAAAGVITAVFLLESKASPPAPPATVASSSGAVIGIGPFQSAASEGFDHLGITGAQQWVRILERTATVSNLTHGGALKLERSSSLDGVLVTPRSSPFMLGQLGISQWVFDPPLIRFGGYFANNSRFDDATVDFYDASDTRISSTTASVPKNRGWTWNGWQSEVPIHRLVITGNDAGFLHGFIWFDDLQVTPAPPPPCVITCPANIAVCNDPGQCGAVVRFADPIATNCSGFVVACVPPSGSFFPAGTNSVLCAAMDAEGHVTNACSFSILVNDCEPPVIRSITASPAVLWPPNQRMEEVAVQVLALDNCHLAGSRIISVTSSNEASLTHRGAGAAGDWQITGPLTVSLRADRSGAGLGLVYSITVESTDDAGNTSTAVAHVTVPHDQR
jgi:RNA polymerase sigma factor (sigma-70 family)